MSFAERFARIEQQLLELKMMAVGRPSVDPSANWTAWTPTFWSGITSLGNGSAPCYYKADGGKVIFDILVQIGSTTTFDGAEIQIEIPGTVITDTLRSAVGGWAFIVDNSTVQLRTGVAVAGYLPEIVYALDLGGAFRFYFGNPATSMTNTSPITLATNDLLVAQVTVPGTVAV